MKKIGLVCTIVMAVVVLATGVYFAIPSIEVVPPNCLEKGYTIYEQFGKTQIRDIEDALGHDFTDWAVETNADDLNGGTRSRTCRVCQYEETEVFYESSELPQLFITGDMDQISKYQQAAVQVKLKLEGNNFDGYALIKYQGHKTLQYEKKNYTVKFFSDEGCTEKHKFTFLDWNKEHKYILKANYTDTSRCRNLIGTDLWSSMVADRENIHPRLAETSNYGTTDGYPVEVYVNDTFFGVYVLSLHKDDDLFEMEDGNHDGIAIINDDQTASAVFRETIDWEENLDWEIEFCGTEDDAWLKDKVNAFIQFVKDSDPETFRKELHQYADVDSLIDYLILLYTLGMPDHVAKDMVLATYDDGVFIANMYNMKEAFGLLPDGSDFIAMDRCMPAYKDGVLASGTDSLLWDRVLEGFGPQIRARYLQLREDILSQDNILQIISQRVNAVPEQINDVDLELFAGQPQADISHQEQMEEFLNQRLSLLDAFFQEEITNND